MEWWQVLLEHLLELVIAIIVPVALHLVNQWLKQKKMEFLSGVVDKAVLGGVAFAEEHARKALKASEEKTSGAKKLDVALEFAESQLRDAGYDKMAKDKLIQLLEVQLHLTRNELPAKE